MDYQRLKDYAERTAPAFKASLAIKSPTGVLTGPVMHDLRQQARIEKRAVDLARLERHAAAIGLLLGKRTQRVALSRAWREVRRWQRRRLCSADCIREWAQLLAGPVPALVDLLGEDSPRGVRLRQNSPFWLVLRRK